MQVTGDIERVMRRTHKLWSGAAGALLVATGTVFWTAPEWLVDCLARLSPTCLYRVRTEQPLIALTIDDGPDPASTPSILEVLRREDARATFFLIAERVRGREPLVRMLVAEGHEIANHFTEDRPSIRLSRRDFEADLLQAHRTLAPFGPLRWARPASGWYTQGMVEVMWRHGYRCALGSVYPFDAAIPLVSWSAAYIVRNARPGTIVILHDAGSRGHRTAEVLRRILPELRRRGYRIVSLSELTAAESAIGSRTPKV